MAQAVAEALVAVVAIASVDIDLAGQWQTVDRCCIFQPANVKILPEGRCTQLEHSAPIFPERVERTGYISGLRTRLQDIIGHKGRQTL